MEFTLAYYASGAEAAAVVNENLSIPLRILLDAWGLIAWISLFYLWVLEHIWNHSSIDFIKTSNTFFF